MSVTVKKTAGDRAEITWEPREDDPNGHIARSVETDQLAYALEALGGVERWDTAEQALQSTRHTFTLARLLERRSAVLVVQLRDQHELSWRQIAAVLYEDADKGQSAVRGLYESGRRHIGA